MPIEVESGLSGKTIPTTITGDTEKNNFKRQAGFRRDKFS